MLQERFLCGRVRDHFCSKCRSYTDISKELTQHPQAASKSLILSGHSTLHPVVLGVDTGQGCEQGPQDQVLSLDPGYF